MENEASVSCTRGTQLGRFSAFFCDTPGHAVFRSEKLILSGAFIDLALGTVLLWKISTHTGKKKSRHS